MTEWRVARALRYPGGRFAGSRRARILSIVMFVIISTEEAEEEVSKVAEVPITPLFPLSMKVLEDPGGGSTSTKST